MSTTNPRAQRPKVSPTSQPSQASRAAAVVRPTLDLSSLRSWWPLDKAAAQLSIAPADVLELALEAQVRLGLNLMAEAEVRSGTGFAKTSGVSGIVDLPFPLSGLALFEVRRAFYRTRDRRAIPPPSNVIGACEDRVGFHRIRNIEAAHGIEVTQDGNSYLLEWYASRESALPEHSEFGVTKAVLDAFVGIPGRTKDRLKRPPRAAERKRFITIIGCLAKKAGRAVPQFSATHSRASFLRVFRLLVVAAGYDPAKSATTSAEIETLTEKCDHRVAGRTIEGYLSDSKQVSKASITM